MIDLKDDSALAKLQELNLFGKEILDKHGIILSYNGPFDKEVLDLVGSFIKSQFETKIKVQKRIYKIFIELAQNIYLYSAERTGHYKEAGVGSIVLSESDKQFHFFTCNRANDSNAKLLLERFSVINSLTFEGLRELKRNNLEKPDNQSGGANLGLIQIAIISSYPLSIEFANSDKENIFVVISVKVDK